MVCAVMPSTAQNTFNNVSLLFQTVSPVTLDFGLSPTWRVSLFIIFAALASLINASFIAALIIEETLRKAGNAFMGCLGCYDFVVSSVVVPISAIVLHSNQGDNPKTCRLQYCITLAHVYAYSLFILFISAENYYKFCDRSSYKRIFTPYNVAIWCCTICMATLGTSAYGIWTGKDFDYCDTLNPGSYNFRITTTILFFIIPLMFTIYFVSEVRIRDSYAHRIYARSTIYFETRTLLLVNVISYIIFIISWSPYTLGVYFVPNISAQNLYYFSTIGIIRCGLNNIIYFVINTNFRNAFELIFSYCFEHQSLPTGRRDRGLFVTYRPDLGIVRIPHHNFPNAPPMPDSQQF